MSLGRDVPIPWSMTSSMPGRASRFKAIFAGPWLSAALKNGEYEA
jgi:hypothetical protein